MYKWVNSRIVEGKEGRREGGKGGRKERYRERGGLI